ncbi:MAG: hypothetical protein LBB09_03220 [Rickettsiales bacterium]|nr:hypothetical protein [Rickettsiales bacterium]
MEEIKKIKKIKIAVVADAPLLRSNPTFLKKVLKYISDTTEFANKIDWLHALEELTIVERLGKIMPTDYIDVTAKGEDNLSIQNKYTLKVRESIEKGECPVVLDRDMLDLSSLSDEELKKIRFLDVTRTNDHKFINRAGSKSLEEQFDQIANDSYVLKMNKIVFVDDVLFTGSTIICAKKNLEKKMRELGIKSKEFSSIFALSLAEENGREILKKEGIESDVISEQSGYADLVDGRDLGYGFKNSGKASPEGNRSYFIPFGNPGCASVPMDKWNEFSIVCAAYSKKLWEEIDPSMTASKYVSQEIGAKPFIPDGFTEDNKFVEILEKAIYDLEAIMKPVEKNKS